MLERIQLEWILLGFRFACEDLALVSSWEVDLVDASLLFSYSVDLDILQSLTLIFLFAVVVVLGDHFLVLVKMDAFVRVRIDGRWMWSLKRLCEDLKGVLLLHC